MPTFNAKDYEYPELPEDTPLLCVITDLKEIPNRFKKTDSDPESQLEIRFEVVEGDFKGEWITTWMNPTFGKKSNLVKLACAAFGVEELETLNTDELVGKRLQVIGDYGEDGKSQYLKPRKYKAATSSGNGRPAANRRRQSESPPEEPKAAEPEREPVAAGKTASSDDLDF